MSENVSGFVSTSYLSCSFTPVRTFAWKTRLLLYMYLCTPYLISDQRAVILFWLLALVIKNNVFSSAQRGCRFSVLFWIPSLYSFHIVTALLSQMMPNASFLFYIFGKVHFFSAISCVKEVITLSGISYTFNQSVGGSTAHSNEKCESGRLL